MEAVQCALDQSFKDIEVIVVDDASTDGTADAVRNLTDERVVYFGHDQCGGGSAARNTGIQHARGHFIAFLDDDDLWLPEKLEKQVHQFEQGPPTLGVVYTDLDFVDTDTGSLIRTHSLRHRGMIRDMLYDRSPGPRTASAMVRKECFDKAGMFDEELTCAQEPDLWIRVSEHYEFDYVPESLVKVRLTHQRIGNDSGAQIQGRIRFLSKHGDHLSKRYKGGQYCKLGNAYCDTGDMKNGRKALAKAIACQPGKMKYYAYFVSAHIPVGLYKRVTQWKDRLQPIVPKGW